jgi:hypothetical protein
MPEWEPVHIRWLVQRPEPTTIQVTWEMLRGGAPIYVLDPAAGISGLGWTMPWPCTSNPTPYDVNVTIRDVAFF